MCRGERSLREALSSTVAISRSRGAQRNASRLQRGVSPVLDLQRLTLSLHRQESFVAMRPTRI
jgi:hypothetical protein